ncbi:MAG TPA: bacteriohemerythrin [Bryobacteraceae bacterium]|jgi:hemerythrin|nr:bacteriohemerythrin [Bryobacteraceae bacterium]
MFDWKPEYSVQIPEIDAQHQRLFVLAAELHAALTQGKGYTILEKSLARLVDYTKVHFAAEERRMAQHAYPEGAAHKAEHDHLTAQVLYLQKKFRAGDGSLSLSVMMFLKNWLEHHIAGSDQQYSIHIRGRHAA